MSNVSKGTYFKARSKKWLEDKGFTVALLERMFAIGPHRFVKKDQMGADLLAASEGLLLFVQVKGGITAAKNVSAGRKVFDEFPRPPGTQQVVMLWVPRARAPRLWVRSSNTGWREVSGDAITGCSVASGWI